MASRIRVISPYDKIQTENRNWVQEFATQGITLKPENSESLTLNEVAGKIITENISANKVLTLKRAIELGMAAGVKNLQELHAQIPGSFSAHISAVQKALDAKLPKGVNANLSADARISACIGDMPKQVLIKIWQPTNDGHTTTYYLCDVSLDKDGNVEFGDAAEVDVSAQFSPVDISKHQNSQSKTERDKVHDIEQQHAQKLERDRAFTESVNLKKDRAEKRERKPRVLGQLTGDEFHTGIKNAAIAQDFPNPAIGKIISELSLGTRSLSAIPTEDFNEIYEIARENAGETADKKFIAACDTALVADRLITGAAGQSFWIPSAVLQAAVETAKVEMEKMGGLWCYSEHQTDLNGADDQNRAVAIVKIVDFCAKSSVVILPQIEFLSDSDGAKRIIETARQGKRYGISARFQKGSADTHYSGLYNETKTLEYKSLRLMGWDIVTRPGIKEAELYWL